MEPVLIVDDEASVRDLLARWLGGAGYRVATAESADAAIGEMNRQAAAVVFADVRMPGRDGLSLARELRERYPETAVIMATSLHDLDTAVQSLRSGVVDYLVKPFSRDDVREAAGRGLAWHQAAVRTRRRLERLEAEARGRQEQVEQALLEILHASEGALDAILSLLKIRDRAAGEHARRVADWALSIAGALGLPPERIAEIERGALLHDVGKIAMPDAVLHKSANLTSDERRTMDEHPMLGYHVLRRVPLLAGVAEMVRSSHERFDGRGYPDGLAGEAIPLGSRIVAVADAFDAMTSGRVYRGSMLVDEACREIVRASGTQFDPRVVSAFLRAMERPDDRTVGLEAKVG